MARPTVRTATLLRDEAQLIRELFGSIPNAYARLGLEGAVPLAEFRRALGWLPVKPEHAEVIKARWWAWQGYFLDNDFVGVVTSFDLPEKLRL